MSTMNDYQDIIDNLPKPTTDLEEQYLYSIVMAMAGKDYQPFLAERAVFKSMVGDN